MKQEVIDLRPITNCGVYYQKPKEGKILDALEQIYNYAPLGTESDSKTNAVQILVSQWFRFKMSRHYKELSSKIYELQREVIVDLEKHKAVSNSHYNKEYAKGKSKVKIPLFCNAGLRDEVWKYKHESSNYTVNFESNVPFIPTKAIAEAAVAKRHCYEIYTKALKTQPLDEILTTNPNIFPDPAEAELKVLWYVRPHELKINVVQNKDPAIVLQWRRPYLVHQWDEDIMPIEELLLDALKP